MLHENSQICFILGKVRFCFVIHEFNYCDNRGILMMTDEYYCPVLFLVAGKHEIWCANYDGSYDARIWNVYYVQQIAIEDDVLYYTQYHYDYNYWKYVYCFRC